MSAKRGKLLSDITLSTAQDIAWTDGAGGPLTATIAAATYQGIEQLASTVQTQIRALAGAVGDNMTVTISAGESGTGRCTITSGNGNASVTWTSTDIRDALGFTAGFSGQSSVTGSRHVKGLWLPDTEKFTRHGDSDNGRRVTDLVQTVGPTGVVKTLKGRYFDVFEGILWDGVTGARAKKHLESITGESFETFWKDTQLGESSLFSVGTTVYFFWDADAGTSVTGKLIGHATYDPARMREGWNGRYVVALPTLVKVGA